MNRRIIDKVGQKRGGYSDRQFGLSPDCCNCLKGILAVCVLVHHLYQHSDLLHRTIIGVYLQAAGYLSVACFFFLSGYGLYTSYQEKGEAYIKCFIKRKIIPFYSLLSLLNGIYFAEGVLLGKTFSSITLLKSFSFGGTVIVNGWYLQVQLLLYLFFFITFRIVKKHKKCMILGECFLFCAFMYVLGYSSTWYESVFAFVAGMSWRELELHCRRPMSNKNISLLCGIEFILVCSSFVGSHIIDNAIVALILKMLSAVCFAALIVTAVNLICVEYVVTRWLGKYSTEIYVFQGLFLTLFHSQFINIANQYIYIFMVVIATFVTAFFFHPVTKKIYSIVRSN